MEGRDPPADGWPQGRDCHAAPPPGRQEASPGDQRPPPTPPEWLFAKHSPLRVVCRCAGQQIVITHGVPWDQTLFHTAE